MLRLADGTWPTTDQAPTIQPNYLHTTLATAAVIGSETQAPGLRLPTTGPILSLQSRTKLMLLRPFGR